MEKRVYNKIFPILFIASFLFMGIGYAAISDISLDINGSVSAIGQEGIFIESIDYVASVDAINDDNEMIVDYGTLLNDKIVLSDTNKASSITYEITVYNNTNETYAFYDTLYSNDEFFYDNQDIVFSVEGIDKWDEIKSKERITFTITFEYKDGIENITNNELNSIINFQFSKFYNITYKNIINNNNYPTRVFEGENISITFVNDDIPDFVEISGAEIYDYANPNLVIANVENDITITGNILFILDKYTFNGTSDIVNTGVALFSEENVSKDFEITFEIAAYGNNENVSTMINSLNESYNTYPGFLLRFQNDGNDLKLFYVANSSAGLEYGEYYDYEEIKKVQIIRIDNVLYYRFNDFEYVEAMDYSTLDRTFDTPVTFGAALDGNGNPFRYFQGTLTNMVVKFLADDYQFDKTFKYDGEREFIGSDATEENAEIPDYIDTEMYLFSQENRDRDFEISFEIIANYQNGMYFDTLVNILDESKEPYFGIALRGWGDVFQLIANVDADNRYTYDIPRENLQRIRLVKINGILYLIVNNDDPIYICDFSSFNGDMYNLSVIFGASLDANNEPWRYFNGILSDMSVRFLNNIFTIDHYEELYNRTTE